MSFDQEWSQLKAAAAEKQQTRMQLNQLRPDPGGSGSPGGDLQVSNKDLAAIGDEAFKLYQRLDKDGDHAKRSSEEAAGALKADFSIGGALGDVTAKWESAANSLLESCAHISNHLDYTQKAHAGDEYYIATAFSFEQLDKGFSEGTER
jgi:hypothetical protein